MMVHGWWSRIWPRATRKSPGMGCAPGLRMASKPPNGGGWRWQNTRITDPQRATRHCLAIAVATLWVLSVGGEADASLPPGSLALLPERHIARRRTTQRSRPRLLSCFRRGIVQIVVALLLHQPLPLGRFLPAPWPTNPASLVNVRLECQYAELS